jgi:putative DNA primase/helicase
MNLAHHAKAIARAFLGEPNKTLSTNMQLRFGTNGSVAVEIAGEKAGTWYDHENGVGGGMMELIQRQKGFSNGPALDWLRDNGIDLRPPKQKIVATYIYCDQTGTPAFKVTRWGAKKTFSQSRYDASTGGFVSGKGCMDGVRRIPYRLDEWGNAEGIILIAEGEKDVDRLRLLKLLATCNAGGAGKWSRGYAPYFQDREVIILPDNDQIGRDHAREIAVSLQPVASRVAILELPGLPDKGDVSDWLDAGHTADELRDLIQKAPDAAVAIGQWEPSHQHERPTIRVAQGDLHVLVSHSHHMLEQGSPNLFQFGGSLSHAARVPKKIVHKDGCVTPEGTLELVLATREWLQLELCRIADWERPKVLKDGGIEWVPTDAPMKIPIGVLADVGRWRVRVLNGIVEIPILRPDGSICAKDGYDDATGILFDSNGVVFPHIPENATKGDAVAALKVLEDPLSEFPFVEPYHKAAAVAMTLTALIRRQLKGAPAFGVSAREPGTGKGLLIDTMSIIATGRKAPITPFTEDEDEQRKRITSSLLAGHALINIDNVNAPLNSAALAALLTSETWSERILGVNKQANVPSNATVVMTGNNLVIEGDMTRRVIPIELDARCERPELRTFSRELIPWIEENRPALVAAALTILSAWRKAGRKAHDDFRPLGSYEQWSREIAACLVWLGRDDPLQAMASLRESDPPRLQLRRLATAWYGVFEESEQTVGATLKLIEPSPPWRAPGEPTPHVYDPEAVRELREAIMEITPDAKNDHARRIKLGLYLKANRGKVAAVRRENEPLMGLRFVEGPISHNAVKWRVEDIYAAQSSESETQHSPQGI